MYSFMDTLLAPPRGKDASFAETMAFNIYASRESRLETLISELAAADDPNDERVQDLAFTHAGFLGVGDLLPDEKEYVEKEIARRWSGSL